MTLGAKRVRQGLVAFEPLRGSLLSAPPAGIFLRSVLLIGIVLLFSMLAYSRLFKPLSPDELAAKADVVCNAIPFEIRLTDEKQFAHNLHYAWLIAKLRIIGKSKGDLPSVIQVRYATLDKTAHPLPIMDGPHEINLELGKRYHCFLKHGKGDDIYIGALNGDLDDGSAFQEMLATEPDRNPPVLKQEAVSIASKCVISTDRSAKIAPEWIVAWGNSFSGPTIWDVRFYSKESSSYRDDTRDAEIFVNADRTIGANSWVCSGAAFSPVNLRSEHIGKLLRLTGNFDSGILAKQGIIDDINTKEIRGRFKNEVDRFGPNEETISFADILSVQVIRRP